MKETMNRTQLHNRLDRLEQKREKVKKQIRYLSDREAMMERVMAEYDRRSRTHRLCCRAGMMESC